MHSVTVFGSHFKSTLLCLSYYLEPYTTLGKLDRSLLCRLWHHSFTNSALCCLGAERQPENRAVLVWCCVFCLQRKVAIKLTFCWVRFCQAHTHCTLLSHLSAPYPLLSFFSFFSPVGRKTRQNESRMLLSELGSPEDFGCFYSWCLYANLWLQGPCRNLDLCFHEVRGLKKEWLK